MGFNYPADKLVLSHSTRSQFRRCPRLLEFNKLFGDSKEKDEQFAAEVGKALHEGFQEYLVSRDEEAAIMKFLIAYPHDLEYAKPEYSYNRSLEACYYTLENMINSRYLDQFELVHIKTQLEGSPIKPAIEVPFAFEIVGAPLPIPVWFVGFIDAVLYDKYDDMFIVNDIKTNRVNLTDKTVKYEFDEQTVPYGIILEHILGRQIKEFKTTYLDCFIDLSEPRIQMYPFTKTEENVYDWYRGLCEDIRRISKYYQDQWFPRATNGDTCFAYNKPCWFANECSARDPELIARLISGSNRPGLFHDNQLPWVTVKLEYKEF